MISKYLNLCHEYVRIMENFEENHCFLKTTNPFLEIVEKNLD